ncbi:hypothetical protein [Streptomyces mirabilis]|uniref:hypothetical protein n=1 Tax=Streptomyces mirabilis TaxID=68239 RepID=UPI0036CC76AC
MPEFAHAEATAGRALDVIDQPLQAHDEIAEGRTGLPFLSDHEAVTPAAWSWWMLISDSARVVREETVKGNGFVVVPTMRNLMTHTVARSPGSSTAASRPSRPWTPTATTSPSS